mgnify:CR=1 FL=1
MLNNKTKAVQNFKEQFMHECTILDPKKEYPGYIGKEKYFIVTNLSETELKSKYASLMEPFRPYLVLDKSFINARADFKRNEDKHKKRAKRTEDIYGYVDGETEIFHKELVVEEQFENFITSIQIDSIYKAAEMLPQIQKERFFMYYIYGISKRKIAEMHHVSHTAVNSSLAAAIKTIRRLLGLENDSIF